LREHIRAFVASVAAKLPALAPVYEFGSYQVPGQETLANLRPLFPGREYVGCDMRAGPGVDVVADLHELALPDACAGLALCLDTLEHVEYPHAALREMHRILRPDGVAIISSVMNFPIHDYPHDYWRFTPEAFRSLMRPFAGIVTGFGGDPAFPHTVVGIGFKDAAMYQAFVQ
jgi:SAM-dependent methyltransferase